MCTYFRRVYNTSICRGVARGGRVRVRGARATPEFGRSVNPIQTRGGGQILPLTLLPAPLDSKSYLHLCHINIRICCASATTGRKLKLNTPCTYVFHFSGQKIGEP